MSKSLNVLIIMVDQMRADCLGIAGHPDVKTPYLDTLATRGIRFTNAYSACPSCIPARTGFLTGLSQEHHGRVGYLDGIPWNYTTTLTSEFSKFGYYTQCVGKMHVHPQRNLVGFNNVKLHNGIIEYYQRTDMPYYENQNIADDYLYEMRNKGLGDCLTDSGMDCNGYMARPWPHEEQDHPTNWVTTECIDFLRSRDRDKPFLLMASYVRPHPPFDAPKCYFDMYRNKTLRPPVIGEWSDREELIKKGRIFNSDTGPSDPDLIREAQIGYYACITHLDHQIGRLLQAVDNHKLSQNTLVVFLSDHGEMLCDHHLFRKVRPYQGSINVPLIVSGPSNLVKDGGRVSETLIELRDIMPTLLEAIGAPIPENIDGHSFFSEINNNQINAINEYIHGEHTGGNASNHYIVTQKDKYVWYSKTGKQQYFDLLSDPYETHDLINDNSRSERVAQLRNILINELQFREEGFVKNCELSTDNTISPCLSFLKK